MKRIAILFILVSFFFIINTNAFFYNNNYVEIKAFAYDNQQFYIVSLKGVGRKIKAKYFSCGDDAGNSVGARFSNWCTGKSIILYSSGTYMSDWQQKFPQGLTIENGFPVNQNLVNDKMDGLVIVRNNGDIIVADLKGTITLVGGNIDEYRKFDLRGSNLDKCDFIKWGKKMQVTAFQAHLLVFRNELKIAENSSLNIESRRFLAMGTDKNGNVLHFIIQCPFKCTLLNGVKDAKTILKSQYNINFINFMINLDTGGQDVFRLYGADGGVYSDISGKENLEKASNLLSFYYEY